MSDFIFTINNDKKEFTENTFYCLTGQEDYVDGDGNPIVKQDSNKVLAKKIVKSNSPSQYFVRLATNNKLYNPMSQVGEDKVTSIIDNTCRATNRFIAVNAEVFGYYLQFIGSKNLLWLNKAEREKI